MARDILALLLLTRSDMRTEAEEIAERLATVLNIGNELVFQAEYYEKMATRRIAEGN